MSTIRVISNTTGSRWQVLLAGVLICVALSGCGANFARDQTGEPANTGSATETPEPLQADPILFFVGSAGDNEKARILVPTTGEEVQVFAGRAYNAASGRLCRRYRIFESTDSSPRTPDLACRDRSGRWQKVRPLLNLDTWRISTMPE